MARQQLDAQIENPTTLFNNPTMDTIEPSVDSPASPMLVESIEMPISVSTNTHTYSANNPRIDTTEPSVDSPASPMLVGSIEMPISDHINTHTDPANNPPLSSFSSASVSPFSSTPVVSNGSPDSTHIRHTITLSSDPASLSSLTRPSSYSIRGHSQSTVCQPCFLPTSSSFTFTPLASSLLVSGLHPAPNALSTPSPVNAFEDNLDNFSTNRTETSQHPALPTPQVVEGTQAVGQLSLPQSLQALRW